MLFMFPSAFVFLVSLDFRGGYLIVSESRVDGA
jgi:hypothetical protein